MRRAFDPGLCLVIGPDVTLGRDPVAVTLAALRGGVTMVQVRWKDAVTRDLMGLTHRLLALTLRHGVPLIVNDRVDVAHAAGADGVHVGQGDLDPRIARAMLGPSAIIGLSVEKPDQVSTCDPAVVDYAGLGPVFGTATKPDHAPPLGIDGFRTVRAQLGLPVMAIGGVDAGNAAALRAAGAEGLAVVSAICGAASPEMAARSLRQSFAR